jgi:4-methylaminobutanoate oxidase (formaldehyde-forming)
MTDRFRAVVIGGGVTGCSVAYHLALSGWRDVLLVDKGELTGGSTAHAAGLVTAFNPSPTMMRFRRYSIELYRQLGVFNTVGSLRFASSRQQLRELQRGISRARAIGLDAELLGPREARELMPAASQAELHGAVWMPGDGFLDPHTATHALANAARDLGATIRTGERVTAIELSPGREVAAVRTERGRIECDVVVNAAGMWAPRVSAMVGAFVPSTPVDHQHVALRAVPGHELPRDMPCFRDPDNLVYGKSEAGGVLFGGYEGNPVARWIDGVPWEHGSRSLTPDQERFEPLMRGAIRRFPFLEGAEMVKLVCHPDAMTPDANPLLGPMPGARGFFLAAGLSLNGFGGAGGIGRAVAEWVTAGEAALAVRPGPPRPGIRRGAGARGLSPLLPPSVPVRSGPVGQAQAAVGAPRPDAGAGRGVRRQERLGAGRARRARDAVAAAGRGPAGVRVGAPAVVRTRRARARRVPRGGRPDRPVLVR